MKKSLEMAAYQHLHLTLMSYFCFDYICQNKCTVPLVVPDNEQLKKNKKTKKQTWSQHFFHDCVWWTLKESALISECWVGCVRKLIFTSIHVWLRTSFLHFPPQLEWIETTREEMSFDLSPVETHQIHARFCKPSRLKVIKHGKWSCHMVNLPGF